MSAWNGGAAALVCSVLVACGSGAGPGLLNAGPDDAGQLDAGHEDGGTHGDDAGTRDAGTRDGGVDGGASADAGADAGTVLVNPCTWDGGHGPGGAEACATPAPADLCRALNPSLGSPVVSEYREIYEPDRNGAYCGEGAYPASGEGVLLHPKWRGNGLPSFDLVDRTGAYITNYGTYFSAVAYGFTVVPLPHGFGILMPLLTSSRSFPLFFVSDRGEWLASGFGIEVTALPGGGPGTSLDWETDEQGCEFRSIVRRYSETGQALLPDWTDLGCNDDALAQMAGNASGCVLAAAHGHITQAFWLDEDLRVVGRFTPTELATEKGIALAALLDGSFAIRIGEDWTYRLRPGATSTEPAPCWLRARPGTSVTLIQGGRGYAVIHASSNGCDRIFEVFTPDGRSCGFTHVDGAEGQCDLALGLDGTISKSAEAIDAGQGEPRRCVLKFWPGALGPTGL